MFSAIGRLKGSDPKRYEVRWHDGKLEGDPVAVEELTYRARLLEGELVGPGDGPFTTTRHLSSGVSTVSLIQELMVDPLFIGDVPQRSDLPPSRRGPTPGSPDSNP